MSRKRDYNNRLIPYLNCKDYTVSGESYEVMKNNHYEMLVTSPVPVDLENYYKSETYISHTDSSASLIDKVYQRVRTIALQKKLRLINSFKTTSTSILDIGAGTGDFLKVCNSNNWETHGIEPSADARKIAKEKGIHLKEKIEQVEGRQYDVISLWHVLEHVEDLCVYVTKLKNMLSDKGRLVIAVPNYKSYDASYYKEHWAAFDVPRHLWHFSQTSIHKIFSEEDMIVEKTIPMKFDAYYVSLLSEKYKTGKMNAVKAFCLGFASNFKARRSSEYSSLIYVLKKY